MPYFGVPIRNGLPIGLGTLTALAKAVAVVVPPVSSDPYFEYVSLLANTTSTNGAQNNTFLDSSTNAFSVTRNGNTTQGTFSPFSQTGWSNYFDGTGDFLSYTSPGSTAFDLSTGNWTVEAWIYKLTSGAGAIIGLATTAGADPGFTFYVTAGNQLTQDNGLVATTPAGTVPINQWVHVAAVRNAGATQLYIDGTAVGSTIAQAPNAASFFYVGSLGSASTARMNGYISNARIVKGTAVYTSNFTPPTSPLTAISGTSLLTCQSNRFIDNSSNNFTITRNGDVSVQAFSPFNPTAAWSASTNGGSGYFDGAGDYLTAASNDAFRTDQGDWTIEGWLYATATGSVTFITRGNYLSALGYYFGTSTNNTLYWESGTGGWTTTATYTSSANAITLGQWNHVAAVRSGTTFSMYANGVRVFTQAGASFGANVTAPVFIGTYFNVSANITGYFTDFRFVKGTAVYTGTTYTVPTAPLTAITNTSLLLNFTNAGIYDSASGNDLETVGNAQVSTVQAKWGTTSMAFDGTGDWLSVPNRQSIRLGSADFTIEFWYYPTNLVGIRQIVNTADGTGTTNLSYALLTNGTAIQYYLSSTGTTWNIASGLSVGTATLNTWQHIALVRSGSIFTPYLNGVAGTSSASSSGLFAFTSLLGIGSNLSSPPNPIIGYIDDLRITNGYARYTANFTPPTAAFPLN